MPPAHVFMFHVLEEPQLSVGPLGKELRLERSVEFFNGHFGSGSVVQCWAEGKNKRHEPPSTKSLMRSTRSPSQHQGLEQSAYPQIRALPYQYLNKHQHHPTQLGFISLGHKFLNLRYNEWKWPLKLSWKQKYSNHLRWKKQTHS